MTSTALLTALALVVSTGSGTRLDSGYVDGLRPGDKGRVFYELSVGGKTTRVDVTSAEILSVGPNEAVITTDAGAEVRPGFLAEFEVPAERVSFREVLAFARSVGGEDLDSVLEQLLPAEPAERALLSSWLAREDRSRLAGTSDQLSPAPIPQVLLAAGSHRIGLPAREARFYNQQPPFQIRLRALSIDSRPVRWRGFLRFRPGHQPAGAPGETAVGIPHDLAEQYCQWRGARLPTEFEWEVAARANDLAINQGILEWTASWYAPYPGNDRPEANYGERFRVLRGGVYDGRPDVHRRRYLDPEAINAEVGFRCVQSAGDAG